MKFSTYLMNTINARGMLWKYPITSKRTFSFPRPSFIFVKKNCTSVQEQNRNDRLSVSLQKVENSDMNEKNGNQ
jgi:hypothetical protein